jgi:hypothetical protein
MKIGSALNVTNGAWYVYTRVNIHMKSIDGCWVWQLDEIHETSRCTLTAALQHAAAP